MDVNKLIPVTEYSLRDFREAKEENKLRSIYMERWLEYKKKYFSNFLSYAFDKEGNLYRRDFLTENGWQIVANFNEDDLDR
tara:strand:- start:535 stop:777 length:243 start_codon:yes stop_codon:yes gene_type:complete